MARDSIAVILMTYNEELHIERCIRSLKGFTDEIFIVDSYSKDKTVEIAESLGAKVFQNPWTKYADQFNWGIDNLPITSPWTMRMDCDEYLEDDLIEEINQTIEHTPENVAGYYIRRKVFFKGKWIKHGGFYPHTLLRIWRTGEGRLEDRFMDEHAVIGDGETPMLKGNLVDDNLNNLTWWIGKHNNYATREALDLWNKKLQFMQGNDIETEAAGSQEKRKRWIKEKIYSRIPYFVRPFFYFIYRYFILLGFLDGREGLVWHFLQGYWYRFLVDAKMWEIELAAKQKGLSVKEYIISEPEYNRYFIK